MKSKKSLSTAFTVAKFAYSAYEYLNATDQTDQFKLITKLLNEINTKLDVINDKLDKIYFEIQIIPNRVEYARNISILNGIFENLKPLFKSLNEHIRIYGRRKGIRKFLQGNGQNL